MIDLSNKTKQVIDTVFLNREKNEVMDLLKNECADNLPFLKDKKPEEMERFRFAAIKLSKGQIDRLYDAIELAKSDWRDLLVAAGFGNDISAHELWANEILKNTFQR